MIFAHLHCHSSYSFLRGASPPEKLAKAAAERGYSALAITEVGGLYSAVAHQKNCDAHKLKPIFGVQLSISSSKKEKAKENEHIVLLARNKRGWSKMSQLVTKFASGKDYDLRRDLHSCGDLYLISRSREQLQSLAETISKRLLFAELIIHDDDHEARSFARWASDHQFPVVASNQVHFVDKEQQEVAAVLSAMRLLKTIGTLEPEDVASPEAYLAPPDVMQKKFSWLPVAIANAAMIVEDCNFRLTLGKYLLPRYDNLRENSSIAELRRRCLEAVPERYQGQVSPGAISQLGEELRVVGKTGFADYLLMVHDIVQEAARRGIRTFGRGSAAASLICYLLKITYVDPIKYNLTFERFMNDSRSDMPDIDLDFPWNRRDEMVEWVYERFGKDRVAMISTFQTFRARGSVREVAKAYGVPDMDISRITKRLPYMLTDAIDSSVSTLPECRDLPLDQEPWKSVIAMARRIAGFPRHISVHPCGLVIAPSRLDKILPLEAASKGLLVTQMDMYPVEDIGLVKMDLLGQRAMAVISDSVAVVNKRYGKKISLDDLLLDDKTKRIMRTGQSMGCFYVESPGMRNLMAKLKVEGFELLTAASSVIRPGPSDSGMMKSFVERHCGREPVRYLHPAMEEILKETYGVMIYQEDVMRIAHEVAGMSLAEADKMRRAMTKKRAHEPIERMKESFLAGAAERGIEKDVAAEIWRQIAAFAGYAFCKSHSASFAQVSIQSAHLKAHYPAEFMAAVLSNDGGFYRAGAYIQEARRLGLKILPPYISKAKIGYQGGKDILMVGLMAVKSLSSKTMQRIVDRQPYGNLTEFLTRVRPARNEAESLVGAGALDRFGYSRPQLMWLIQAKEREEEAVLTGIAARDLPAPNVPDYELAERMERENDALEFTVTAHPLALYKKEAEKNKAVIAKEFSRHRGKVIAALGWLVHRKRTRTQRGDNMMFMSMEDLSDAFEAVLFPGIYDRYGGMIKGNGPYLIYGKVVSDAGVISINVQELQNLG